jgi:hypothetical protein
MKKFTDKQRLDFVAQDPGAIFVCGASWAWWDGNDWVKFNRSGNLNTPRQAIDAAMRSDTRRERGEGRC